MNITQKIMGLAALPLAGLLATGGVAMAHTAGTPAGEQVVRQAVIDRAADPCPQHGAKVAAQRTADPRPRHPVTGTTQSARQHLQVRDRDRGTCDDHQPSQAVRTAARHGDSCDR